MKKDKKKKKKKVIQPLVSGWRKMLFEVSTCYEDVVGTTEGNQNARIRLRKTMQDVKSRADELRKLSQDYAK